MVAAPLPPEKLAKPNPSAVGSKTFSIRSDVDDLSVPSFAISPFEEAGRVRFGLLFSLLDWPSGLGVIVSVDRIPVSTERADWSEDCPPPQARLQHTKEIKRITLNTVEYIGAGNELSSITADHIHDFKIGNHRAME
jgi:hypothetical protein